LQKHSRLPEGAYELTDFALTLHFLCPMESFTTVSAGSKTIAAVGYVPVHSVPVPLAQTASMPQYSVANGRRVGDASEDYRSTELRRSQANRG
jgi:hypothetical protein